MLRIAFSVIALLALPAPALAAEGFVGVLENGRLVRFDTQQTFSLSRPVTIRGMLPGERIVALAETPRRLVGVGTSARLYSINPTTGRSRPIGPPFPEGLRGSRFSLAVAPEGVRGRLISDVGQDLMVNLVTGQTHPGPGLKRADTGAPLRPAVDATEFGLLVGAQLGPLTLFRETAFGASTMTAHPVERRETDPRLSEPIGFQLGTDGNGYVLAVLADRQRVRQSVLLPIDPATGKPLSASRRPPLRFLPRRLTTFASIGRVREDHTPTEAQVRLPRSVTTRALFAGRLPLQVRASEACQVTVSLRIGGRRIGFGFGTRDTPGTIHFLNRSMANFSVAARDRAYVRRYVGQRIRVVLGFNDFKGNRRSVVRSTRLIR